MVEEEHQVHTAHTAWIDAVNAGNLPRLLDMMTDDAVFLNPGQAPLDKAGFAGNFPKAPRQERIYCVSDLEDVVVVGEVAYAHSRDTLSITPPDGRKPLRLAGHRLTVYRRQADGRWLLARDAHTLSPVEAPGLSRARP